MRHLRVIVVTSGSLVLLAAVLAAPLRGVLAAKHDGGRTGAIARTTPSAGQGRPQPPGIYPSSLWSVVPSPNPSNSSSVLQAVGVVSGSDIWAVGEYQLTTGTVTHTLAEHWNGTAWSIVTIPTDGNSSNRLLGVSAVSSSDVWAVGDFYDLQTNRTETLIEHWNGSSWSIVPSPNVESVEENTLWGVAAVAANDVWAVGLWYNGIGTDTQVIEHWNGSSWSVVAGASLGTGAQSDLYGVAALAANNVWAVGTWVPPGGSRNITLIEHWNGSQWSLVSSPNVGMSGNNGLLGVAASSANNVWVVGGSADGTTLIEHWDGSQWSVVPSPSPGPGPDYLSSVAIAPGGTVWAVGTEASTTGGEIGLIERWWGAGWVVQQIPALNSNYYWFYSVAAVSDTKPWAVGFVDAAGYYQTLVEDYRTLGGGSPPPL